MKIALASAKFKNNDVPFNLRQIEDCMLQAKEAGAELVCFGEAFLQGFDALTWYWERDRDVAVTTDSEVFRALERLTADTGIDLLVALNLPSTVYNMFPYIISLVVLVFVSKKSRAPKAEGIPYDKGQR